ncbi:MAG: TonB family protein [Candidatus Riflebacteria bacterium]|nr:TonB family protein [Candidatus Riflebacteria bacterium]
MAFLRKISLKLDSFLPECSDVREKEEFQLSLLVHFAFFLLLSVFFAVFHVDHTIIPKNIAPVRLISGSGFNQNNSESLPFRKSLFSDVSKFNTEKNTASAKNSRQKKNVLKKKTLKKTDVKKAVTKSPVVATKKSVKSETQPAETKEPEKSVIKTAKFETDAVTPFALNEPVKNDIESLVDDTLGEPLRREPETTETVSQSENPGKSVEKSIGTDGDEFQVVDLESFGDQNKSFAPPSIVSKVIPDYPEWARKKGIKGQATYKVMIMESGTVGDVIHLSSTVDSRMAVLGAQALRRWLFTPVLDGGEPVRTWVKIAVHFQLK